MPQRRGSNPKLHASSPQFAILVVSNSVKRRDVTPNGVLNNRDSLTFSVEPILERIQSK